MNLCNKARVLELVYENEIKVGNISSLENSFIDDFRIGLKLRNYIWEIIGPVNIDNPKNIKSRELVLEGTTLESRKLYLGVSQAEFSLSEKVLGMIATRSTYARLGLEMVRSSFIVAPGFGKTNSTPLVLEIMAPHEIVGLSTSECYATLSLFEITCNVTVEDIDYWQMYPLRLLKEPRS